MSLRKRSVAGSNWQMACALLVIAWVIILALFWDTAVSIVTVWNHSKTYEHGVLVLPVFLYLIYRYRRQVENLQPVPEYGGLCLLAGLSVMWILGKLTEVQVLQQLAMTAMLVGIGWVTLGTAVTRALLFPFLFLFFGVPIGEELVPALQDYTAWFVVKALQASGVPVFWEGRLLTIPSGAWEVHESCSGIRYVIASLTFGYLYAGLTYRRWRRRVAFFAVSAIVPIVANGLRAYGIVMLAHLSGNSIAVGVDHFIYGWLFFGFVILLLILLGERWRETPWQPELTAVRPPLREQSHPSVSGATVASSVLIGLAILALAPLSVVAIEKRTVSQAIVGPVDLSIGGPWTAVESQTGRWAPHFTGASVEMLRSYKSGGQVVDVYLVYYDQEKAGAELISTHNDIVDRHNWTPLKERTRTIAIDGIALDVRETVVRSRFQNRVIWSWYWIDGRFTANPYFAKLLQLKTKVAKGYRGGAAVVLAAGYSDRESEAIQGLNDFLANWKGVGRTLSLLRRSE